MLDLTHILLLTNACIESDSHGYFRANRKYLDHSIFCRVSWATPIPTLSISNSSTLFDRLFASAPVTTVGGGLADMFEQRERGSAVVFC